MISTKKKLAIAMSMVWAVACISCEYNTFELTSGYSEETKNSEVTKEQFEIIGVSSGWSELALLNSYTNSYFRVGEMVYYMVMVADTKKNLAAIQVDCIRVSDAAEESDFTYVSLNSVRDDTIVVFIPRTVTYSTRGTWQVLFTAIGKDGKRSNRMGLTVLFGD